MAKNWQLHNVLIPKRVNIFSIVETIAHDRIKNNSMAWLRFAWLSLSAQQAWASSSCYFRSVGPACWRDNELLLLLLLRHLQYTGIKKHRTAPAGNVKYGDCIQCHSPVYNLTRCS
jgi:hypothetical protein